MHGRAGMTGSAGRPARKADMSRRPGVAGKGRTRQAIQVREVREGPAGQGSAGCTGQDRAVSSREDRAGWGMQALQAGRRGQGRAGQDRLVRQTI